MADILRDKPEMQIGLAQRINRSKAVGRLAELNLKMACYNSTLPAGERLSMIDFERIQATKLKSDEVMRFADSLLALRVSTAANSPAAGKPSRFTETRPSDRLEKILVRRDSAIVEYLTRSQGIPVTAISVRTIPAQELGDYTGKDIYAIHRYGGREHRRNGRQYGRRYGNNGYIGFRDGGSPRDCTGTGGGTTHANRNCEGNGDSRTFRSDGNSDAVHPGRDYDHRIRGRNYDDKNPDSTSGRACKRTNNRKQTEQTNDVTGTSDGQTTTAGQRC